VSYWKKYSDMKNSFQYRLLQAMALIMLSACSTNYVPKPAGYPRIDFPEKKYTDYNSECPFTFRYPSYAKIVRDSSPGAMPCFLDMKFPSLNATIHITYKSVSSYKSFYEMSEDARTFAYKHTVKAENIIDSGFYQKEHNVSGIFYDIEGNTASSLQFYATDSSQHYLRAALYFNARPNKDSLAPVINFIHHDMDTIVRTLRWK
jgi:gliding motility-associated lipoprotein GldD